MSALSVLLQVVVLTHATVIDPDSPRSRRDQTIVVRGTRIAAVGPSASTPVPPGARVVNATGKFVIPGLWDMHVHTDVPGGRAMLPLYIAHGVTGVRDMNGRLEVVRGLQREVTAGTLVGPRMVVSGPFLVGRPLPPELGIPSYLVRDSASAVAAVTAVAASGADFLKVHNGIPAEAYRVVAAEARRHGMVFAGHVAAPTTVEQAAASGQRSQEHLYAFTNPCTGAESAVVAAALPIQQFVMGACTSASQAGVYAAIARHRTWVTPTLIVQELVAKMRPTIVAGDQTAQFYSEAMMQRVAMEMELPPTPPPSAIAAGAMLFRKRMQVVRGLHAAGVPLLGGTDSPLAAGGPGASLVGELRYLVAAGLSPREALRTVTTEPARYFATDSVGAVAPGQLADLVVLDADPLTDIGHVARVDVVVANGRVYDRVARAALVEDARQAAPPVARQAAQRAVQAPLGTWRLVSRTDSSSRGVEPADGPLGADP
ncbi:MAG: amidohydrolase family protein, partial [Gemmatimonadaceae bacterium]